MSVSFVIGNGSSRQHFDLRQLHNSGSIYGCNAIHREVYCPNVICKSRNHLIEALSWQVNSKGYLWTTQTLASLFKDPAIEILPKIPFDTNSKNLELSSWSSIAYATLLAAQSSATIIFIGVDLGGDNIYKETDNYPPALFKNYTAHIEQLLKIMSYYSQTQFVFINDIENDKLESFSQTKNVTQDSYTNLETLLLT